MRRWYWVVEERIALSHLMDGLLYETGLSLFIDIIISGVKRKDDGTYVFFVLFKSRLTENRGRLQFECTAKKLKV